MILDLGYEITITTVPAMETIVQTLTVERYIEYPLDRSLKVKFMELPFDIIVFNDTEYDAIAATWTDADVLAKMQQIYPNPS
jgi:alpha-N-acetylglucosamine transferase